MSCNVLWLVCSSFFRTDRAKASPMAERLSTLLLVVVVVVVPLTLQLLPSLLDGLPAAGGPVKLGADRGLGPGESA
jgi:hypothetical protein